ncbi:MAG: sugar ABC transporter permease [Litorilinea sp.]
MAKQLLTRRGRGALWGYFFILPSLLAFVAFSLYPMVDSIILSFQRLRLTGREWVGLENYERLASEPAFFKIMGNTFLYALLIVPPGVLLALVLATLIFRLPQPMGTFFKSAFYLPVVTSGVVLSMVWLYLYNPAFGLLNHLLGEIGVEPVLWLADPRFSIISLVIMYHASHWGGSIIILTASMGSIPRELYEAAAIEGAGILRQAISITVPLLKPALTYISILGTIASLQIFTEIFVMTRGGPNFATTNMVFSIYEYGFIRFDFGRASAVAIILLVITITFAIIQFRVMRTNVEY